MWWRRPCRLLSSWTWCPTTTTVSSTTTTMTIIVGAIHETRRARGEICPGTVIPGRSGIGTMIAVTVIAARAVVAMIEATVVDRFAALGSKLRPQGDSRPCNGLWRPNLSRLTDRKCLFATVTCLQAHFWRRHHATKRSPATGRPCIQAHEKQGISCVGILRALEALACLDESRYPNFYVHKEYQMKHYAQQQDGAAEGADRATDRTGTDGADMKQSGGAVVEATGKASVKGKR